MPNQSDPQNNRIWEYKEAAHSDRDALEEVINETLLERSERPIDPQQLEVLRRVASKHAGQELNLQPILVELVDAILKTSFQSPRILSNNSSQMSLEIAHAMYDAPSTRARLVNFWKILVEASQ